MKKINLDDYYQVSLTVSKSKLAREKYAKCAYIYRHSISIDFELLHGYEAVSFLFSKNKKSTTFLIVKGDPTSSASRIARKNCSRAVLAAITVVSELVDRGVKIPAVFNTEFDEESGSIICTYDPTQIAPTHPRKSVKTDKEQTEARQILNLMPKSQLRR